MSLLVQYVVVVDDRTAGKRSTHEHGLNARQLALELRERFKVESEVNPLAGGFTVRVTDIPGLDKSTKIKQFCRTYLDGLP